MMPPSSDRPDELATLRLDSETGAGEGEAPAHVTLVVFKPDEKIEHVLARGETCTIGRSDECDVHVAHPSISRRHVRITHGDDGALFVEDLGSANGTTIGGNRLQPGERGAVKRGEVIALGKVFVVADRAGTHAGGRIHSISGRGAERGASPMAALEALVERVAKSTLSVLVLGETGAGKEVLAERIHQLSPRADKPLLRINCAALSEQLLESELFGHERGAFTGAVSSKMGLLESADGGTVFLDEVGELPLSTQAKLLRVLEDRKVLRVGGLKPKQVDVRFIAATNRDVLAQIAEGRFRQDLYFRLNGMSLFIPPLRSRVEEIEPLAKKFAAEAAKGRGRAAPPTFTRRAKAMLEGHAWPGNVRELRNVIERAIVLADGDVLDAEDLALAMGPSLEDAGGRGQLKEDVEALEHRRILAALAECDGNQTRAAKMLGIARGTLVSRLERFGVARPRKK